MSDSAFLLFSVESFLSKSAVGGFKSALESLSLCGVFSSLEFVWKALETSTLSGFFAESLPEFDYLAFCSFP